jgi:hypothetical protein
MGAAALQSGPIAMVKQRRFAGLGGPSPSLVPPAATRGEGDRREALDPHAPPDGGDPPRADAASYAAGLPRQGLPCGLGVPPSREHRDDDALSGDGSLPPGRGGASVRERTPLGRGREPPTEGHPANRSSPTAIRPAGGPTIPVTGGGPGTVSSSDLERSFGNPRYRNVGCDGFVTDPGLRTDPARDSTSVGRPLLKQYPRGCRLGRRNHERIARSVSGPTPGGAGCCMKGTWRPAGVGRCGERPASRTAKAARC